MTASFLDHGLSPKATDHLPHAPNHRSFLLMRLLKADVNAISDVELLEVLLSSVPTITDAHALAIRLLERFLNTNNSLHVERLFADLYIPQPTFPHSKQF